MKENNTQTKEPKKKKLYFLYILLAVIITLLVLLITYTVYVFVFYKPTPPNDPNDIPFDVPGIEETENNTKESECYNFLIIGRDAVALNTDVIMLLNYDITQKKMSIMQIPRDTYVEVNNIGYKINSMYATYYYEGINKGEKDPEEYGMSKLSSLLEQNLCININYYAMVNLEGFRNIVDILGGVEVDIPANMYYEDPTQGLYINLKAGKQLLDGKKAEGFIRYRAGYVQADIGRMDAQKIFMSALLKEVKDHFTINTIVKIANEVFTNVKTNVSLNDMIYFAKNLLSVDLSNMSFMSMTGYAPTPPDGCLWYYVMNRQGVMDIVNNYFNVYDFEITDEIFDKNRIFTSTGGAYYLNPYYLASPEDCLGGKVDSAGDIVSGSIDIPRN